MSLKFSQKKKRNFILTLFYWIDKLIPISRRAKLRLYLDVEWSSERLAHEKSYQVFATHPVRMKSFDFLKRHLASSQKVVDIGCGNGELSRLIALEVLQVIAIDHNADLQKLENQSSSPSNLTFRNSDAIEFFRNVSEFYDVIILSHVLEHLDEPLDFLTNHRKFARFIYIEVPDFERTPLNVYRNELNMGLQYSDNDHIWEFTRKDMAGLFAESGLVIIDQEFRFGAQKYWCSCSS